MHNHVLSHSIVKTCRRKAFVRKQNLIEMVVPIIGLVLMFVFLFTIRPSCKFMVSAVNNCLVTEKQYIDVTVEKKEKGNKFQAKDESETVIVYTDDLKSCEDIHIGDKVNVMKYKSWAVSSRIIMDIAMI